MPLVSSAQPLEAVDPSWLFDLYGAVIGRLGSFVPALEGLDLMAQYQVFLEEEQTYHLIFLRLSYRLRQ